jgi:hypothetical protein
MHRSNTIILLAMALAAFVTFDLIRTIRSGRAHGKYGIIRQKGQPGRFRRYVYADWIALALCASALLWALISRETFQR